MVNPVKPTREEVLRQIAENLARAYDREADVTPPDVLIERLRQLHRTLQQAADARD